MLKRFIKWLLRQNNAVISRPPGQFEISELRLAAIKRIGLAVKVAVDAGAADGEWVRMFHRIYPDSIVLCVEPRRDAQPALKALARRSSKLRLEQALLGSTTGECDFNEHGNQSSMLRNAVGQSFGQTVRYPVRRLDDVIEAHGLTWPELIKLDLQGAEVDCLSGAPKSLSHAQVVLMEVSFIPLYKDMPLCVDVIKFMHDAGFRLYDIVALLRRPLDTALAQGDFLFVRNTSPLVANPHWSTSSDWS